MTDMGNMKVKELKTIFMAANMLTEHGLHDWRFDLSNWTTTHAQTQHRSKRIVFSRRAIAVATREQLIGITYHEMAHAIVGPKYGHGRTFKEKYYELSGNMDFAGYAHGLNTAKFIVECTRCQSNGSTNKSGDLSCRKCWNRDRVRHTLTQRPNPLVEVEWR